LFVCGLALRAGELWFVGIGDARKFFYVPCSNGTEGSPRSRTSPARQKIIATVWIHRESPIRRCHLSLDRARHEFCRCYYCLLSLCVGARGTISLCSRPRVQFQTLVQRLVS